MKRLGLLVLASMVALVTSAQAQSQPSPVASSDLFKRMQQVNAHLRSFTASVHLDVAFLTFPFIKPSLDGTAYFKQPNRQAVVFDTIPSLARQFKKVYPNLDPPSAWPDKYDFNSTSDDGTTTTFRLVPKHGGRVQFLDVKVDDATATIRGYKWTYTDGGYVAFDQSMTSIDGNYLIDKQSGHVELPSYRADVSSEFSNYKVNVAVADSIFEDK